MAGPTPSWNLSRVYCTWYSQGTEGLKAGTYKVTIPARITSAVDDSVVPQGVFATGALSVKTGSRSLDIMVPATDDPDILERGWKVIVDITFTDTSAPPEKYVIDVPVTGEVNLRTIPPVGSTVPPMTATIPIGGPGGFVLYDAAGLLKNADGSSVSGGTSGPVSSGSISDASDVGKSLLTAVDAATARGVLGAGTSNLTLGATSTTAKSGDYVPTWGEVTGKPATFPPTIGTTAATAKAGNYVPTWAEITSKPATFAPTIGTTSSTAKAGDYTPAWGEVTGKPTVFPPDKTGLVKADVGLGNVDNTSDANKPLSTAAVTALSGKVDFVIVTTGDEARPAGSLMTFWNEQRAGTPAAPTNMNSTTDVWFH